MYSFNPYAIPNFAVAIWIFLVGFVILLKKRESLAYLAYFGAVAWIFGCGMAYLAQDVATARFWLKIVFSGIILIAPTFYHFTALFLKLIRKEKKYIIFNYVISFIFVGLTVFSDILIYPKLRFWGYYPYAGNIPVHLIFLLWFSWTYAKGLYNLIREINKKDVTPFLKLQIKYLIWTYIFAFLGGIDFLPDYNINFYPFGYLLTGVGVTFTAYAILRYRLLDIEVVLTRVGIFVFVYLFVLGIPFLLGYRYGLWRLATWITVILATAGPFIFNFLRRRAEDIMLKEQRRYQRALLELSKTMTRIRDLDKLLQAIVLTVVDQVKVNFAAIYLKAPELQSYQRKHYFPKGTKARFKEFIALEDPLIGVISQRRVPLSAEEIGPQDKIELDSGLLIPCFIEDNLLGFLVLGAKPNNQMYTTDDLIVFETLSYSTSLAIENSQFWREIEDRQRKARLQEMDTYSYSLAHEIDNPMYIILGQARLLQKQVEAEQNITVVPEKKKELTDSFDFILEAARRVSGMVKAIRDFGSPTTGELQPLDLEDVVNSFFSIYLPKCKGAGVPMEKIYPAQPLWVLGEKPLLMQVMVILANNSLHAVTRAPEKKITVKVDIAREGWVRIAFTDTGYGIPKELLPIIFQAFTTTKASSEGTGMGLYNAEKIVRQHKGRIWAESEGKDKGATLFVELPLTQEVLTKEQQKEKKSQVAFVSPPKT